MKEYGVFKKGVLIERCDTFEQSIERVKELNKQENTGSYGCRRLSFRDFTDKDKYEALKVKLENLETFISDMEGSGRTYRTDTRLAADEFRWLMKMAEQGLDKE